MSVQSDGEWLGTMAGMDDDFDILSIDPNVRRLVALIRAHGFTTTDSGDGGTKIEAMECALDFPHVVVRLEGAPEAWVAETRRLVAVLRQHGVRVSSGTVQMTWCPVDDEVTVLVVGISDADLTPPS